MSDLYFNPMKKIFLFAFVALVALFPVSVSAQDFAVGAGCNFVSDRLWVNNDSFVSHPFSFYAGFDGEFLLRGPFSLSVGANFVNYSGSYLSDVSKLSVRRYSQQSISFPVRFKLYIGDRYSKGLPFLYIGPSFELGLSSRLKESGVADVNLYKSDYGQRLFNVSASIGAGYMFFNHMSVIVGYQRSLINYVRYPATDASKDMVVGRGVVSAGILFYFL